MLIASPRTGSQALNRHLNQYDGMVLHGEIFNPSFVGLRHDYHEKIDLPRDRVDLRDVEPEQFIARIFDDQSARFIGFHIFPDQTRAAILPVLEDESVKKLWLSGIRSRPSSRCSKRKHPEYGQSMPPTGSQPTAPERRCIST
ncbi:MAG: hypothetical protein E5Y38_12465 [Mesorhizobium sp.]|nr:MAG: hypothetical protein E5Y38_12465 [Mesorhizobium sp.]